MLARRRFVALGGAALAAPALTRVARAMKLCTEWSGEEFGTAKMFG